MRKGGDTCYGMMHFLYMHVHAGLNAGVSFQLNGLKHAPDNLVTHSSSKSTPSPGIRPPYSMLLITLTLIQRWWGS